MTDTVTGPGLADNRRGRLNKQERRRQILLELKLRPHVRITELAQRFNVSSETVRRDFDTLASDGLVFRAHGGALAPSQAHHPGLQERAAERVQERERIGRRAAALVEPGETLMIDSGSTTLEMARAMAVLGTPCTVVTNSIPVATTLGHGPAQVLMCPGEYIPTESAVIGTETLEFIERFHVDRCAIGASNLSGEGPSETVRGFAAVKRQILKRAKHRHLLVDAAKFGTKGMAHVALLSEFTSIILESKPTGALRTALERAEVRILLPDDDEPT